MTKKSNKLKKMFCIFQKQKLTIQIITAYIEEEEKKICDQLNG